MLHGGWGGWGWTMLMPLLWLILIALVVWAAIRLSQRPSDQTGVQRTRETPQEIRDRRFASGEIDAEAYVRARDLLAGRRPET